MSRPLFSFAAIRTRTDWQRRRRDIRERLAAILGPFPKRAAPLHAEIVSEERRPDYLRRKVSYQVAPGESVRAWLLLPHSLRRRPRARRGPAVLCLHQTLSAGKDGPVGLADTPDLHYAHELARRGYVTLTPDHLAAGERTPPGATPFDTAEFYRQHPGWSAVGKTIWDVRRAVDYLVSLPFVDPEHIGCLGHSLGGSSAVFAMAFEPRLRAGVANCGLTTFAADTNRLQWCRDRWYVYLPQLRPIFLAGKKAPFDFHEVVALIAPRAFLNISALNDPFCTQVESVNEALYAAGRIFGLYQAADRLAGCFHWQGHRFPEPARALAYAWLDQWLQPA